MAAFSEMYRTVSGAVAGIIYYDTGTERAADTARPVGTIGKAADEADYYRWDGSGWVVDNTVYDGVAGLVQPIVDEAIEARDEIRDFAPRVLQSIATLGETIHRTTINLDTPSGATAITNGLRFTAGGGNGAFIVHDARADDVAREMIPVGTIMRERAVYGTDATETELGLPNASFATRILYSDATPEDNDVGAIDTERTRYVAGALIVETTFTWAANILSVGHLTQFSDVGSFSGDRDVTLVSHELLIDSLPAAYGTSADDLLRAIEAERQRRGHAIAYTVKGVGGFGSLSLAEAGLGDAPSNNRQRLLLQPAVDDTKIALPENTDLVGVTADVSRMTYAGSTTLTDATRTDYDPLRLKGNHLVRGITVETENSNYALHSESANAVQDWVQTIEDCIFRHKGNEVAFGNGGLSEGGRHIPAIGVGMSSGSRMVVRRTIATSFKGGGGYWHNAQNQLRPCGIELSDVTLGGDSQVDPDIQISTLGSTTADWLTLDGATLTNGVIAYGVSSIPSDPLKNMASHADIKVTGRSVSPHIFMLNDPGRAMRVRALVDAGPAVVISGEAAAVLFDAGINLGTRIDGDTDTPAAFIGALDVVGHTIGQRVDLLTGMRRLIVTVGGSSVTYTFGAGATATSNAAHLSAINTALSGLATVDLVAIGYRPEIYDQEARPINTGPAPIYKGTLVLLSGRNATCRSLEPSDFSGGALVDPRARVAVSLEFIPRNRSGRVQHRGYINWEHLVGDGTGPNLGDGFTVAVNADGVHGTLVYAGSTSTVLRCIQGEVNDGLGRYVPRSLLIGGDA